MALTEIVPTLPIVQHTHHSRAAHLLRAATYLACLSLVVAIGVASSARADEPRARSAKAAPAAKANSGNPQYYEVFGKRYRVRESSHGYRETGVASWYGRPFHGRPTSSGEKYDMNEMTAAHTTLPLPTWVEVTNLTNGKRIVVKVNDRGPFVGKRVIDLSYAAAHKLDIVRSGTAQVEIRALDGPPLASAARRGDDRRPSATSEHAAAVNAPASTNPATAVTPRASTPPPAPTQAQADRLFAEAGRFSERVEAVEVVNALKAQGLLNAFVVTEDGRRKSVHRVRVGPLADATEVDRMNGELRELGARRSRSVVMD